MALMYYTRMKTVLDLLPLLLASPLPAYIVSVYVAGMEKKLIREDLSLRDTMNHYNYTQARSYMVYMHILFMEAVAALHRSKLRLVYVMRGLMPDTGFNNPEHPLWLGIVVNYVLLPLFGRFVVVKPDEIGTRMLSLASSRYPAGLEGASPSSPAEKDDIAAGTDGAPDSGVYAVG